MKHTEFLNLRQPEFGDPANILDMSENMGVLDTNAKTSQQAIQGLLSGSVSKEEYDRFVGDLAAEMVKYSNSGMANVSNVGAALDSLEAKKVNVGAPLMYDLPVSEGFEITHAGHYWKTSFGLVTVTFEIIKTQAPFGPGGYCIATLPVGFRPVGCLAHFNAVTRGSSGFQSTYSYVTTEGAINVNLDRVNGEVAGTISFYAES